MGWETQRPDSDTPSEPGYAYHATNEERAIGIADGGKLLTHRAGDFTEQDEWPDGSTEKRTYHSANAGAVWAFAPEEGRAVILRTPLSAATFKREQHTGDLYTTKPVPAAAMEILLVDGRWVPLKAWAEAASAPQLGSAASWFSRR